MNAQCDIGLIGLAVMGQNLILNMADHGFKVAAYNRTASKVDDFLAGPGHGKSIVGCKSPEEFVGNLQRPRRVMLMVKAGEPVGQTIAQFAPILETALNYYDGYRSERLPHNLLQAQRDYFGAHTYERLDRGGTFHTEWIQMRRKPKD